jgi:hypothetical protein
MTIYLLHSAAGLVGTATVPAIKQAELPNNISGHGRLAVPGIDVRLFRYSVRSLVDILADLC